MNKDIKRARELYFRYGGSLFHMQREGDLEEYKSYKIETHLEKSWQLEYQKSLINNFDNSLLADSSFMRLCDSIRQCKDLKSATNLAAIIEQKMDRFDSFTALRIGEEIIKIRDALKLQGSQQAYLNSLAQELLSYARKPPLRIDESYKATLSSDVLNMESIHSRISKRLNEI